MTDNVTPTQADLIERLREVLTKCHDTLHECTAVLTANDCATVAGVMAEARAALEQKP